MIVKVNTTVSNTKELKSLIDELVEKEKEHNGNCTLNLEIIIKDEISF